ncbi:MAG: HNH endonuclease [Candidatus Heimdallarchaeota archaeon]|nr:HNH endonuclease [Candidatus Heimdallarchaeota archaeon]
MGLSRNQAKTRGKKYRRESILPTRQLLDELGYIDNYYAFFEGLISGLKLKDFNTITPHMKKLFALKPYFKQEMAKNYISMIANMIMFARSRKIRQEIKTPQDLKYVITFWNHFYKCQKVDIYNFIVKNFRIRIIDGDQVLITRLLTVFPSAKRINKYRMKVADNYVVSSFDSYRGELEKYLDKLSEIELLQFADMYEDTIILDQEQGFLIMRQVMMRLYNKCVICNTEGDLTVDHIVERQCGGNNTISNLTVICNSCHDKKNKLELKCGHKH